MNVRHYYEGEYLARLKGNQAALLEVSGTVTGQDRAKHEAARRWAAVVNNWGELGG